MRRAFLLAMAVVMAAGVGGLGGAARGAGEEGNGKVVKVDEGRKAKALELVKKAGMTDADDGDEQQIRENVGVVAAALGDEALLKSAVDDEPNRWRKIQIYTTAAHEQAERGNVAGAKKSVAAAVTLLALPEEGAATAPAFPGVPDDRTIQLQNIASAQAAVGDLAGAEVTAGRMKAGEIQMLVYLGLGGDEMRTGNSATAAGDFDKAESLFAGLSARERFGDDWGLLALEEAGAYLERAKKLLSRMKDPMAQAEAAAGIAAMLAQGGQAKGAATFIEVAVELLIGPTGHTDDASKRAGAEESLAEAYGAMGDKTGAKKMLGNAAARVTQGGPSAMDLLGLAMAQDRLGQTDDSYATLKKVIDALPSDEKGDRTHLLWYMSEILATNGDVWGAAYFIDEALGGTLRVDDGVYPCATAERLAMSDGEDAELDWIERLGEQAPAVMKRQLYAAAARGMVESGENPKVRRFEAMAAAGDAEAMARLGAIFDAGLGVAKDMRAARSWYQKAAGAGDTEAADWLKAHPE
ncbi:MAG TPA: hypothetical protein VHQ47_01845 [Phycisphaerae bacterium]|nr:hypothetical protein [Phycisphaerae bacterium]